MNYKFLFLLFLSFHLYAQKTTTQFSKTRIYIQSNVDIKNLIENGIAADHGVVKENTYIESVFSQQEIDKAKSLGYKVAILVDDMQDYYIKNIRDRGSNYLRNPGPCETSGTIEYETPSNFNLGTMGGFLTYTQILSELDDMQAMYPNLITLKAQIGSFESIENRPIYWVKISDNPNSDETEPEMLYTALHHAREPASVQQLIFYMWYLLENYASDSDISALVDNTEMYFIPVINIDGYIFNETTNPGGGGFWRKNRRDNGDGTHGVDLNRNYSFHWNEAGTSGSDGETYAGTSPFSEPETQAVKWFCEQHEFVMALNNHTYSELLLYPFGYDYNQQTPDHDTFGAISELMVSQNGYTNQISSNLYAASGDSDDWMYGDTSTHNKIFAMTPEIGYSFWPSQSDIISICKEMMYHNLTGARLIHNYADILDESPLTISSLTGELDYKLQRLGLGDPGDFTVSILPLSNNIISVGNPNSHNGLEISEEVLGSISYTLNAAIANGDEISYKLIVNNGLLNTEKIITKIYGSPTEIFFDNGDSATAYWENSSWGISTTTYVSPSSSITDSPSGNYGNNVDKSIVLSDIIDLTGAQLATVSYQAKWDIENNYDYVQFEVSTDNGNSWQPQCGKYTNTGVGDQEGAAGEPVYDGQQSDWVLEEISLSDYLGQDILFRFVLRSDGGVVKDGFYFDDLLVSVLNGATSEVASNEINYIHIYPNPAGDFLNVNLQSEADKRLDIYNLSGQLVSQHFVSKSNSSIAIQDLVKGVYFVKIHVEEAVKVLKLIKE